MDSFKDRLLKKLLNTNDLTPFIYTLTEKDLAKIHELKETKFSTWDWNYGESPAFTVEKYGRYEGGGVSFRLNIENGIIKRVKIFGDFLGTKDIHEVEQALTGITFEPSSVTKALSPLPLDDYFLKITLENVLTCLFQ